MTIPCTVSDLELISLFDGELTENRARQLSQHKEVCAPCASRTEAIAALVDRLRRPPTDAGSPEFLAAVERQLDALPIPVTRPRRRSVLAGAAALTVAAAAAAGVALMGGARHRQDETFVARGAPADWRDRVTVSLGIVRAGAKPSPSLAPLGTGSRIAAGDGVVVQARNDNRDLTVYLMVFGVDASADVHWFYPAWSDPTQNPSSLALAPGGTLGVAPEAVAPERPAPGRFRLHTLLTRTPLVVRQVESMLAARRPLTTDGRLDVTDIDVVAR